MIPLSGFAPDADPTTPGVITDCTNMVPSIRGMKAVGTGVSVGISALPAACLGIVNTKILDGTSRTIAGTSANLYEVNAGGWTSVGSAYTTAAGELWRFAQFGNITIATNYTNSVQSSSTAVGAFAALAGTPPKARIVETASNFVLLFDYNDGVNVFGDGWWCSGLADHTTWTPSASTQAANGRLFDTPGSIVAAKRLASGVAVYKDNAVYLGNYVGPPVIWTWQQITAEAGAYNQGSVVNVNGVHYFLGKSGLFSFDGSRPVSIGTNELRNWLRDNINSQYVKNIVSGYDQKKSLIYWLYPSNQSTGAPDQALVMNTINGWFGRITLSVNGIFDYSAPNLNWLQVGNLSSTWLGVGNALGTWNSPIMGGASIGMSVLKTDGIIYQLESSPTTSSITTGDFGDHNAYQTIRRVRALFVDAPDSATMTHYYKANEGDSLTTGVSVAMNGSKFDLLKSSRMHRLKFDFNGSIEMSGYDIDFKVNGAR